MVGLFLAPSHLREWQLEDASGNKSVLIGEINDRELVPVERLRAAGQALEGRIAKITRYLVKTGNREFVDPIFAALETDIKSRAQPAESSPWWNAPPTATSMVTSPVKERWPGATTDLHPALQRVLARANGLSPPTTCKRGHRRINYQLERLRLKERKAELDDKLTDQLKSRAGERASGPSTTVTRCWRKSSSPRTQADRDSITVKGHARRAGDHAHVPVLDVIRPNDMSLMAKVGHWFHQIGKFVSDDPGRRTPRAASSRPSSAPSSW